LKHILAPSNFLLLLAFTSLAKAQSPEPKKKTFHVVEVRQSDDEGWCMTGTCSATKIEVSGYTKEKSQTISYGLDCIEVVQTPQSKAASHLCIHVQAGEDYPARIYPTAVMFGEDQHVEGGIVILYNIVSQREGRGPKN
jgi:hypothetical protein